MTVLVCAATRSEFEACARGIARSGAPPIFATLVVGVGPAHAERELAEYLARVGRPSLVVSSGFAGSLTAEIPVGTWITATTLAALSAGQRSAVDARLRVAPAPAVGCVLVSSDELVTASRGLPASIADAKAVDMESAALAAVAARKDVPFMSLRLISDSPEKPLPGFVSPFSAAMAATGTLSKLAHTAKGLGGVLRDPRGVARIVRDGRGWTRDLEDGWARFAREIARMDAREDGTVGVPSKDADLRM